MTSASCSKGRTTRPSSVCGEPEGGIEVLAYSFEEVFAEKLRALAERQRPRDLYDVVHLYRRAVDINRASFRATLAVKCEFKGIPVPTIAGLLSSSLHAPEISRPVRTWSRSVRQSRTSTRTKPFARGFGQPRYIFQCVSCGKRFEHSQYDSTLREHKTKSGYPCPSRIGSYVTTKY